MFTRTSLLTITGVMMLGIATNLGATSQIPKKTNYLTFNRPVMLPGVSLGSGTYIFELADENANRSVVRVLSHDRKQVYLTAFTYETRRPENLPDDTFVSFAEAPAHVPQPITAWWPQYESTGRQFIYPAR